MTNDRMPFLYSDQYDIGLVYTGYVGAEDYDQVVFRGDVASREFIALGLSGRRVLAGMNVNTCEVSALITDMTSSGLPVVTDTSVDTPVQ